jgi:hypothetical protein
LAAIHCYVEVVAPGKVVARNPRDGDDPRALPLEHPDEPIALGPLHLVHRTNKRDLVLEPCPQGLHGAEHRAGIGRDHLANHACILSRPSDNQC